MLIIFASLATNKRNIHQKFICMRMYRSSGKIGHDQEKSIAGPAATVRRGRCSVQRLGRFQNCWRFLVFFLVSSGCDSSCESLLSNYTTGECLFLLLHCAFCLELSDNVLNPRWRLPNLPQRLKIRRRLLLNISKLMIMMIMIFRPWLHPILQKIN